MGNILNSLGGFIWGVIVVFIALFAGIVWYAFEYWYIFIAIPVLIFIIFFVVNFKQIQKEANEQMDEIERIMKLEEELKNKK